jgi:DNA-directed RNA polymerase subunit M/transcription elongation factor TFIIS
MDRTNEIQRRAVCTNCGSWFDFASSDPLTAHWVWNYCKVNKAMGRVFELRCPLCLKPMKLEKEASYIMVSEKERCDEEVNCPVCQSHAVKYVTTIEDDEAEHVYECKCGHFFSVKP